MNVSWPRFKIFENLLIKHYPKKEKNKLTGDFNPNILFALPIQLSRSSTGTSSKNLIFENGYRVYQELAFYGVEFDDKTRTIEFRNLWMVISLRE